MGGAVGLLAWGARIGSVTEPGPGFVALAAGLLLVGVGLAMVVTRALAPAARPVARAGPVSPRPRKRVLLTLALLVGYAVVLDPLGYVLATFLLMWGLFAGDGGWRRLAWGAVAGLLVAGLSWLALTRGFRLQFPPGIFP